MNYSLAKTLLLTVLLSWYSSCSTETDAQEPKLGFRHKVIVYPGPEQEPKSTDFEMFVNNMPVFIYQARVSKYPINQVWPGYQRPIDQTEIASFAYFDIKGEVVIKVISNKEIKTLDIRPKEYGIKPTITGNSVEFKLSKPAQFVVEVNGYHEALHIFANPIETNNIDKKDPMVHYFDPGIHNPGIIRLKSNETVYIEGGAVVYGAIICEEASNVKILGRGILDASKIERGKSPGMVSLKHVENSTVGGIIFRDSPEWTVVPKNCDNITFDNLKLIGMWRYNSDGIDFVNCKNMCLKNSFIRTFDDNIVIKGVESGNIDPYKVMKNIEVDNCVLWNDWNVAIKFGQTESIADTMRNISFSNCYIPRFTFHALGIHNTNRAYITDITFKNIYIEEPILDFAKNEQTGPITSGGKTVSMFISKKHPTDTVVGNINNIHFENIRYNSSYPTSISLKGYDKEHTIQNIYFKDYFINNVKVTEEKLGQLVKKNEFVKGIFIE
jgi:hypothetical protein